MSDEQERREWERKQRDRDRLLTQIELGELVPAEAEAEAARLGVAPLAIAPDRNRFDPHKETHWTVLMALAWIMWGDDDHVREFWDSYREKSTEWFPNRTVHAGYVLKSRGKATWLTLDTSAAVERVTGKPPSRGVAEAREDLWRVLREGKLRATGIDTTTKQKRRAKIPAREWHDLEPVMGEKEEVRRRGLIFGGYRDVLIRSADVRSCFSAAGEKPILTETQAETPSLEEQPKKRRGRKPEFDWNAIIAELVRFADKEGLQGQSQRKMSEYLSEWYANRNGGKGPAPITVRTHISPYLPDLPEESDD